MHSPRTAQLDSRRPVAALAAAYQPGVVVDPEAGVIRNAAVMTAGPAEGHPFECDAQTLQQVAALINASPDGVRVRFNHPQVDPSTGLPLPTLGTMVGVVRNARLAGNTVRGDVHLGDYAAALPGVGDARTWLLNVARTAPTKIGLSAVIAYDFGPIGRALPVARVHGLDAVDFVERPAANPNGLLSSASPIIAPNAPGASPGIVSTHTGGPTMDLMQLLQSLGLDPTATTPEQVDQFVATLTPDQQSAVTAAGWQKGWAPTPVAGAGMSAPPPPPAAPAPAAPAAAGAAPTPGNPVSGITLKLANNAANPAGNFALLEAQRATTLRQLAAVYQIGPEFAQLHIGLGSDVNAFVAASRAEMARRFAPTGGGQVSVGEDKNIASLGRGIGDSLLQRVGAKVDKPHERAVEFRGLTLTETCRAYLQAVGVNTMGMNREQVCKLVFDRGRLASLAKAQLAHTPGDFSNILADTLGKTLRQQYDETPATWQTWAKRATHSDFRTITRTQLSAAPRPRRVKAGGEYTEKALSDQKETYALAKFGEIVTIAWETMVNDDLNAFSRVPQLMGNAMKRLEDDVAYYVLLKNAALNDTGNLFNSTAVTTAGGHANLAGSSAAVSITSLGVARAAMRVQVGLKSEILNIVPSYLIVPGTQETLAEQVLYSTGDISRSNSITYNAYKQGGRVPLELVVEPRLDNGVSIEQEDGTLDTVSGSTTGWYVAASSAQVDTVEVCFLESNPAPTTEEEDSFRVDGRSYKIRHIVAAKAIDFRGLFKNSGA